MWFDSFYTDKKEAESCQGIMKALQASTWEDALPILQAIPNLVLPEQLEVLFCELYDLIRLHRRLKTNVSNTSLNGTLDDMNTHLSANVINRATSVHGDSSCPAGVSMTRSYVSSSTSPRSLSCRRLKDSVLQRDRR